MALIPLKSVSSIGRRGNNPAASRIGAAVDFIINGISFPKLPSFKKGTCPTLLDAIEAQKIKLFLENILFNSSGRMMTGSPHRNRAELVIGPDGNFIELWIQTDLRWDSAPTLSADLNTAGNLIYAPQFDLFLGANSASSVTIQNMGGGAGVLKLGYGMPGIQGPGTSHASNTSPDGSKYIWPNDGSADEVLSTNGSGVLAWVAAGGGGMTSFNVDGDTGPAQTISNGNTLLILGGTDLASIASATDTITLNHSTSGATAATYGDATHVARIAVNAQGHVTSASEVSITGASGMTSWVASPDSGDDLTITATGDTNEIGIEGSSDGGGTPITTVGQDSAGILTMFIRHEQHAIAFGTWPIGTEPQKLLQMDVDYWGHITSISVHDIDLTGLISISADSGSAPIMGKGSTLSIVGGTDLSSVAATGSSQVTLNHNTSGVTAATYGDATHVAQIAINAQGHVTSASEVEISGGGGGGGGKILQVLGDSLGSATNTTSSSYVTCISKAITPAATSNKVLIGGNINIIVPYDTNASDEGQCNAQLFRDSTAIGLVKTIKSDDHGNYGSGSYATLAWNYLDSPSSTSAVTYYIKYLSVDASSFGAPQVDLLDAQITVQEVD